MHCATRNESARPSSCPPSRLSAPPRARKTGLQVLYVYCATLHAWCVVTPVLICGRGRRVHAALGKVMRGLQTYTLGKLKKDRKSINRKSMCDAAMQWCLPVLVLIIFGSPSRICATGGSSTGRACNARCNGVDPTLPWAVAAALRHRNTELSPMLPGSYSLRCLPHSSHNSNVTN